MKTLSIIVPVYNEGKTIITILDSVVGAELGLNKEIILVDDGSTDNSKEKIENYLENKNVSEQLKFKFISKENGGKGSAVRKGVEEATGELIVIQDADLEYEPQEIAKLIEFMNETNSDVVYGSRMLGKEKPYHYFTYYLGNIFLSKVTSILYGAKITDMETCYKLINAKIMKDLDIRSNGFDMEPEITTKILKRGHKIMEVPISYTPRTKEEGKKINWKDGLKALFILIKARF